eukprot:90992-Rhodomonas_salina.5
MVAIFDYSEYGNPKKLWANAAWLALSGDTLEAYQNYDLAGNTSLSVKDKMFYLAQQIQKEKKVVGFEWTIFPNDVPIRVHHQMRPIQLEGMDHAVILCNFLPPVASDDRPPEVRACLAACSENEDTSPFCQYRECRQSACLYTAITPIGTICA